MKYNIYIIIFVSFLQSCNRQPLTAEKLLPQLHGNGCSYDSECKTHVSWIQSTTIRNSEYYCRMRAAKCLSKLGTEAKPFIGELQKAINELKYEFDTGDGVIYYGKCLNAAINSINFTANEPNNFELIVCGH